MNEELGQVVVRVTRVIRLSWLSWLSGCRGSDSAYWEKGGMRNDELRIKNDELGLGGCKSYLGCQVVVVIRLSLFQFCVKRKERNDELRIKN